MQRRTRAMHRLQGSLAYERSTSVGAEAERAAFGDWRRQHGPAEAEHDHLAQHLGIARLECDAWPYVQSRQTDIDDAACARARLVDRPLGIVRGTQRLDVRRCVYVQRFAPHLDACD